MRKWTQWMMLAVCGVILSVAGAAAKDEVLEKALADLDRVYIPAIYYAAQNKGEEAKVAMVELTAYWESFRTRYYDYRPDYGTWMSYFEPMQASIDGANLAVLQSNLAATQQALQGVRKTLAEFRPNNGFPKFFSDKLTDFHGPMEEIARTVLNKTPSTLSEADVAWIAEQLPPAAELWRLVEKCPVDPELWSLDPQQMTRLYTQTAQQRTNLNNLAVALAAGDKSQILFAARQIKPQFMKVYTSLAGMSI